MLIIPALRRQAGGSQVRGHPGLYSKFEASLRYIARPVSKKTTTTTTTNKREKFRFPDVKQKTHSFCQPIYFRPVKENKKYPTFILVLGFELRVFPLARPAVYYFSHIPNSLSLFFNFPFLFFKIHTGIT
jgi:hypothetical protein